MAEDERLREALLELQVLRERQAQSLRENRALLSVVSAIDKAKSVAEANQSLFYIIKEIYGASDMAILSPEGDGLELIWPEALEPQSARFHPPKPFLKKERTFVSRSRAIVWDIAEAIGNHSSETAIAAPLRFAGDDIGLMLVFRTSDTPFTNADAKLLKQISAFVGNRLEALRLASRNTLLAAVIEGSSTGFSIADAGSTDRPLIYVNPAFEKISGYSAEEVVGQNCRFLNAEAQDSAVRNALRKTVATNTQGTYKLRNKRKSGELFWNELTLYPVHVDSEGSQYLVATQVDVTEATEARAVAEENRQDLTNAFAHTRDAFLLLDQAFNVRVANAQTLALFPADGVNWARGTHFIENWSAYLGALPKAQKPDDPAFVTPDLTQLSAAPEGQEIRLPDGRFMLVRAQKTPDDGLVVSATDITPLKTTERLLNQRVTAIENAPDGIGILDAAGRFTYANRKLAELYGYPSEADLLARKALKEYRNEQDADVIQRMLKDISSGKSSKAELHGKDGAIHEVSATPSGSLGTIVIVRDITQELAAAERRRALSRQLELTRRQQAIVELAEGIAHDFNNLLSAINGSAQLISMQSETQGTTETHANRILKAGNQAARLINRLLDLGAEDEAATEFDLTAAVREAFELVQASVRSDVTFTLALPTDPLLVAGNPVEASQIAINLVLNANDAVPADGNITLGVETHKAPQSDDLALGTIDEGKAYAHLFVQDTGPGIPDTVIDKIFDNRFTTKGDQGTGVGLAMVANIASRVDGAVAVKTGPDTGTRVSFFWPSYTGETVGQTTPSAEALPSLDGETILLIDDEPDVMAVLADFLTGLGAEVSALDDPELALEILREDASGWSAIVTDYDMGRINGGDIVEALRGSAQDTPAFVVTALAKRLVDPRITSKSVQGVFAKPINLRRVSQSISTEISKSRVKGEP